MTAALAPNLSAQFYWDRNGATTGAGNTNAALSGTWDGATANWNTNSGGTTATETFTSGGDAVFSAGTSADGNTYTVTVATTRNVSSIDVEHGNVTLTGGTAISFTAGGTHNFTVASGLTTTVDTNVTGSSLNKLGTGTLVLGANDKTYNSGTTTISAGTLDLAFAQTFGTVNLSGGTLKLSSTGTTIANLNVTATSTIDFGGAMANLTAANLTISAGVTLNIINWANASDHFFATNWTNAAFDTTGAIPMDQVVFNSPTFNGNNTSWLAYGSHEITPLPEPTAYGAGLLAAATGLLLWRRRRLNRQAA